MTFILASSSLLVMVVQVLSSSFLNTASCPSWGGGGRPFRTGTPPSQEMRPTPAAKSPNKPSTTLVLIRKRFTGTLAAIHSMRSS